MLVLCGPVIGKVTDTTANVLLEVDGNALVTCTASPSKGLAVRATHQMQAGTPGVFMLEGLKPETTYSLSFDRLASIHTDKLRLRGCEVRTMPRPGDVKRLRLLALSCDWPDQLEEGDEDPWGRLSKLCKQGECDVMLHLGDQVYTWGNARMLEAVRAMEDVQKPGISPALRARMEQNACVKLQESYQYTWTRPETAVALAHASHLMIWSDNDVTNDFTVLRKPDGSQEYLPEYLSVAMRVYRMYQRVLWDPECCTKQDELEAMSETREWHFHTYGPCGIFFIDMRGNRISPDGHLKQGLPPLLSGAQRQAIEDAFSQPELKCMVLCAEVPFVGPHPDNIVEQAEKLPFLKDHWPYNLSELTWLLDLCFDWKKQVDGREVLLLGGDIHVGVDSTISDKRSGLSIRHITTSPITNKVSRFFPVLEGDLNERYSYRHTPLDLHRNYCSIDLSFEGGKTQAKIETVLVPGKS